MRQRIGLVAVGMALLLVVGAGVFARAQEAKPAAPQEGVFIHVSHGADDPHRLLMALRMATVMAEGGRGALVYCDIEAVKVLAKDAPDVTLPPFPSAQAQLAHLQELGVRVRACPTCMKVAGLEESSLREGVRVADREEFFSFVPGRILSLDY